MLAIAQPQPRRRARAIVLAFPSGRTMLGIVPPDSTFADLVLPASRVSKTAGFRAADRQNILSALAQQYIPAYGPCSPSTGVTALSALQTAAATAGQLAPAFGPAAPFVKLGASITNLFGSIFGAHAAAVGREQAALCTAIPAANQFLQQIEQAFQSGQVTAGQAGALLDQVVNQYESGVAPILKMSGSSCNAACVYLRMLEAIVAKRKAEYQDAASSASGSPASTTSSLSPIAASSGNPWLWAAAAGVLLLLLKGGI